MKKDITSSWLKLKHSHYLLMVLVIVIVQGAFCFQQGYFLNFPNQMTFILIQVNCFILPPFILLSTKRYDEV